MITCKATWIGRPALFLVLLASASSSHGSYIYTFKGTLPTSLVSTIPAISPGESWIATFVVAPVAGIYEKQWANFPGAVVKGTLHFSGGYKSPYNFAGFTVYVHNVSNVDQIAVYGGVDGNYINMSAYSDLNPLLTADLPNPGMQFQPHPVPNFGAGYPQLTYGDDLGDVSYNALTANNVSFAATLIPEPTSLALASLLGGSLALARRRR
jgi:hypothetical protein